MNGAPLDLNRPGLDGPVLKAALTHPQGSFARVQVVASSGSTNTDLAAGAANVDEYWPDLSVLIADAQPAGKGRMGRSWEVPAGAAMISSVFVRPAEQAAAAARADAVDTDVFAPTGYGWLSILAGVALCGAVRSLTGVPAELKWPNDVVVRGRKLAGILAQLVPAKVVTANDVSGAAGPGVSGTHGARGAVGTHGGLRVQAGPGVVVGAGVNVSLQAGELPTDRATSLLLENATTLDRNLLLPAYLNHFAELYRDFVAVGGDALRPLAGGRAQGRSVMELAQECMSTLGQEVRAELPGGAMLHGTATALGPDGGLLLRDAAGTVHAVSAGDVIHLRRTGPDGAVKYA
ncbi:biotin--[acetyl-CoA-carboxylase] ligase [Specibacter sp. AOP5-B1-6]|uniref:biotin--[acetyl-CoA-carboxylase] ligase n=1 Tax=Specibacter sp. AOP5-B1-6 TaxID=3457653 RepID=UPI00402B72FE